MITERYEKLSSNTRPDDHQYFTEYTSWILPNLKGAVLDLGCGEGWMTKMIAELTSVTKVLAIDKFADQPAETQDLKITYLKGLIPEVLSQITEKFDCVNATEHIEHLPEEVHRPLLKWIKEHLNEGGVFTGSMPNVSAPSQNHFHLKEYHVTEWDGLLKEYFTQVKTDCFPYLQVWIAQ